MSDQIRRNLFKIFWKGVQSVQIPNLFREHVYYDSKNELLRVFGFNHSLKSRNVHIVGAGKAVYQMTNEMERILGSKLSSGIVSVPLGILGNVNRHSTKIEYFEGAENNLPDAQAEFATKKIINLIDKLDDRSTLIVLLSGGGSALLTAPIPPITLHEKSRLIDDLAKSSADIIELNTVRKCLSSIKGGKLSLRAHPASVISLLLSDILMNRASFIASGPTFQENDSPATAMSIIKKYSLESTLPASIYNVLMNKTIDTIPNNLNVHNYVLGNNTAAIYEAKNEALKLGYASVIMSDNIHGNIHDLSKQYSEMIHSIVLYLKGELTIDDLKLNLMGLDCLSLTNEFISDLAGCDASKGVCLVGGGEPTVTVTGSGKGGRSQQLALMFSHDVQGIKLYGFECYILCAGTDGIDGPTNAAGAIGYDQLIEDASSYNLNVSDYLNNNDSYNFYTKFGNGDFHIKTGHTNTNVMDLHIVLIKPI